MTPAPIRYNNSVRGKNNVAYKLRSDLLERLFEHIHPISVRVIDTAATANFRGSTSGKNGRAINVPIITNSARAYVRVCVNLYPRAGGAIYEQDGSIYIKRMERGQNVFRINIFLPFPIVSSVTRSRHGPVYLGFHLW